MKMGSLLFPPDVMYKVSPETNWMSGIEHAEKIGLGTREYELITV